MGRQAGGLTSGLDRDVFGLRAHFCGAANTFLPKSMISRNFSLVAALLTGVVISSCTPYDENGPKPPPTRGGEAQANNKTLTAEEQQRLKEEREKAAEEARKKAEEQEKQQKNETASGGGGSGSGGGGEASGGSGKEHKGEYQFASPVPGKTGFVFSPYNNKVIDVRGIPSGMLVQDPHYPASEKKYFRVP
jgi:hypothetical protein